MVDIMGSSLKDYIIIWDFPNISEVNRQYYILHSLGISQYIECTREDQVRPEKFQHPISQYFRLANPQWQTMGSAKR